MFLISVVRDNGVAPQSHAPYQLPLFSPPQSSCLTPTIPPPRNEAQKTSTRRPPSPLENNPHPQTRTTLYVPLIPPTHAHPPPQKLTPPISPPQTHKNLPPTPLRPPRPPLPPPLRHHRPPPNPRPNVLPAPPLRPPKPRLPPPRRHPPHHLPHRRPLRRRMPLDPAARRRHGYPFAEQDRTGGGRDVG